MLPTLYPFSYLFTGVAASHSRPFNLDNGPPYLREAATLYRKGTEGGVECPAAVMDSVINAIKPHLRVEFTPETMSSGAGIFYGVDSTGEYYPAGDTTILPTSINVGSVSFSDTQVFISFSALFDMATSKLFKTADDVIRWEENNEYIAENMACYLLIAEFDKLSIDKFTEFSGALVTTSDNSEF